MVATEDHRANPCSYLVITILIRYTEKDGYAHQAEVAKASIAFFFLYYVFFGIGEYLIVMTLDHATNSIYRLAGCSMALSDRDQFLSNENEGSCSRDCDELDF